MRLCLKKMITSDIAYHIAISLVCFIILVLVVTPSCSATSGKVIVFYRENIIGVNDVGNDVGHVGVAIQLEDGTWLAGAIEGPGGSQGVTGTSDDTSYNGGWAHVFKTEEEVIKELADSRETESGDIGAHAAYTKMKQITVPEINEKNFEDAEDEMKGFENSGFSIWKNNDCYTRVWDVMESYGVDVGVLRDYDGLISVGDKDWLRQPQDFFQDLPGASESLLPYKMEISGPEWQTINPTDTSQSNTQITSASAGDSSAGTIQSMHPNIQETVQYTGSNAGQASSSSGTFDAYSEGKKIVEEFFASGEAEFALQEALQSGTEGYGQSTGETNSEESNLAGINFTSIKLNSISVTTDSSGGINFDLILKAEKAAGSKPGISIQNATRIGAAAFMTGLAVNNNKFWVNLNPWEVDRIIDEELGQSETGRIMLESDLQMKRDFSNYGNPCANETGKALWNLLDKKREDLVHRCINKFPGEIKETSNIIFKPVQRHWIVPDKAYAYSNGALIYIINASLTINSEPVTDHASFQVKNQDIGTLSRGCIEELNRSAQEYAEYYRNLEERMIQPYVVADINTDEKYEDLREVYAALALAQWYKSKVTPRTDIFRDNLESSSTSILKSQTPWQPKDIWDKYVYSFKNGEYKCWENTTMKMEKGTRTKISLHSAGGVEFNDIRDHLVKIEAMPLEVQDQSKRAIADGIVDSQNEVLFGYSLHVDLKRETQITGTSIRSHNSSQGTNDSMKENRTINEASLTNKIAQIQSSETLSTAKVGGNTSRVTCPDGWMGPDENGECWQMQITGKS